jgi:hypothetical protein
MLSGEEFLLQLGECQGDRVELRRVLASCGDQPLSSEIIMILAEILRGSGSEVLIQSQGRTIASLFPSVGDDTLSGIVPGHYTMVTSGGCLLWESDLDNKDLIWSQAFPDQGLKMAAAGTDELEWRSSLRQTILPGELEICVYPGPVSGTVQIRSLL